MAILLVIILKWNFVGGISWMEKHEKGRMCWKEDWNQKGICRACEVSWEVGEVGGRRVLRARTVKNIDIGVAITGTSYLSCSLLDLLALAHGTDLSPEIYLWTCGWRYMRCCMRFIALCSGRREKNKVPLTENCPKSVEHSEELQYSHRCYKVCEHLLYCLLPW